MTKLLTLIDAPTTRRLLPPAATAALAPPKPQAPTTPPGAQPIACIRPQARVAVSGMIRSTGTVRVGSAPAFRCTLADGSGELDVLFLGRREIPGLLPGGRVTVEGRAGTYHRRLALWNPRYKIEATG